MANFVKLTSQYGFPVWMNMDLVEQFQETDEGTELYFVLSATDENGRAIVKESPEAIMGELALSRSNQGHGFGEIK